MARSARNTEKDIESLKHRGARRKHIPTAELETLVSEEEQAPKTIHWKRLRFAAEALLTLRSWITRCRVCQARNWRARSST